jgi:hypothetical protein
LPFRKKAAKLTPRSLIHVQGGQEAEKKDAQAQVSQAEKAHEAQPQIVEGWTWPPDGGRKGKMPRRDENMGSGKKMRVRIRTGTSTYVGDFLIPAMRNRLSDVLNEEERVFINLTDVVINDGREKVAFVTLNKNLIESMALVE